MRLAYNSGMSTTPAGCAVFRTFLALVAAVLLAAPAHAEVAAPAECPLVAIYEVRGVPLLGDATLPDAIILESGTVATVSGCPPTRASFGKEGERTSVRAHWNDCGGGIRDVQLDALIGPYCQRMIGTVTSDDLPPADEFYAARCEAGDACLQTCKTNDDCPATNLCERAPGACRGPGLCRPVPPICAEAVVPSCGCDGVTYLNECERRTAGETLLHKGACR